MNTKQVVSVLGALFLVVACNHNNGYSHGSGYGHRNQSGITKSDVGTLLGAAGGAVLGSNVGKGKGRYVAIAAGTLLGAALGHSVGQSLDRADMQYYHNTSQRALETGRPGQTLPWRNPRSGNYGSVTPLDYYQRPDGRYCREYTQAITVGGRREEAYGRACRQPDGSWQIVQG